jgi:hypothetical protein
MATTNLTTKTGYLNAKKIVDSVVNDDTSLYVYIGRPQAWPNESTPPDVDSTLEAEYSVWRDMTAMKRVIGQDITLGFSRIDWVSGTIFDEYSDFVDLSTLKYYVYTSEKKVYKCISNNNGTASTTEPTHTTASITETEDGYRWKYMFTLSDSLIRKFGVSGYLPISADEDIQSQATIGSIDHIKLLSGGAGYLNNASIENGTGLPIYILGDGAENASATCNITASSGAIESISMVNLGSGYPYASDTSIPVMIRQITATGAVETAFGIATTGVNGQILQVTPVIGGTGYTTDNTGSCVVVQSSCYGYAETNNDNTGTITNVEIATARQGSGFRRATAIIVADAAGVTPASIKPVISPFRGHGASPDRELLAKYVLINLNFAYDEGDGDFTIENNFRRIGLIENPYNYGTETVATVRTLNAKHTLVVSDIIGAFAEDDVIYGQTSGAKGFHVDLLNIDDTNMIRYIRDDSLSNNIDFIIEPIESASGASASITEIIPSEVEPYSGDILFINNRVAVSRSSDQIETITLVLEY